MEQLPKLYSRTATGAVQEWQVIVEGNTYYTISGQIDGAKITSAPTVVDGKNQGKKNETTPEQQAHKDAKSHWDKKKKLKYFEDIADIDVVKFIKVMRAKNYGNYKEKMTFPRAVQRKYNGARCLATKGGFITRGGERYVTLKHIEEALAPVFKQYPDLVIDGEAYSHDYKHELNNLMKLVRKTVNVSPEDFIAAKNKVRLFVYDGYGIAGLGEEDEFNKRFEFIKDVLSGTPYITIVPTYIVHSHQEIESYYKSFLKEGYEGAMVRDLKAPYEHKKSKYILKYKPVDDDEFEIVAVEEGEGGRAGTAGTVQCKMKNGEIFGASIKGSYEQAKEIWENRSSYVGKIVTIYFNGFTGLGKPNFAQFDVDNYNKDDR
jgi:ATP-dependent DNA ligase